MTAIGIGRPELQPHPDQSEVRPSYAHFSPSHQGDLMDTHVKDLIAATEEVLTEGVPPQKVAAALQDVLAGGRVETSTDRLDEMRVKVMSL